MDDSTLKSLMDWDMALKQMGNQPDLVRHIFLLFLKTLPTDYAQIKNAYLQKDWDGLEKTTHRLHGAVCYVGLPKLKNILHSLETELKNHIMDRLPALMAQMDVEVAPLINSVQTNPAQESTPD